MQEEWFGDNKSYSLAGTDQEVRFIQDVLALPNCAKIFDLYCGYGRHAIELVKKGYTVVGFDASESFLDIARKNARDEQIDIQFVLGDMRELNYDCEFDAVINMFAAFGYFTDEENTNIIRAIARALKPGGKFLIDLLNREWMMNNTLNRYWRHPSGEYVLSYKVDLKEGISRMKRTFINQIDGTKKEYEFALRAYSRQEMEALILSAGMKVTSVYGGFDKRIYGSDASRMIMLAEKM
jgi:SAM-dependent methyltransferase